VKHTIKKKDRMLVLILFDKFYFFTKLHWIFVHD